MGCTQQPSQTAGRKKKKKEEEIVSENGLGRGVGAGEKCVQAKRTAHHVRAGRGHRLSTGLLPQRKAAL